MFFWRTALVGGVAIALLPSEPDKQRALLASASEKMHWAMTYCDRQQSQCEQAQFMWAGFVEKAQFGLQMAGELANQYAEQDAAAETQQKAKPAAKGAGKIDAAANVSTRKLRTATIEPIRVKTQVLEPAPKAKPDWDKFRTDD